jgi:hypothetical protein
MVSFSPAAALKQRRKKREEGGGRGGIYGVNEVYAREGILDKKLVFARGGDGCSPVDLQYLRATGVVHLYGNLSLREYGRHGCGGFGN